MATMMTHGTMMIVITTMADVTVGDETLTVVGEGHGGEEDSTAMRSLVEGAQEITVPAILGGEVGEEEIQVALRMTVDNTEIRHFCSSILIILTIISVSFSTNRSIINVLYCSCSGRLYTWRGNTFY